MAINVRPPIVTSGLVLNLDAANMKSYPRSGTTWRDLSGNNNSGSLINGPTFSSANGGSIVFDGVDDYVVVDSFNQLPTGSSARTINIWFNPNITTWQGNVNSLFFYGTTGVNGAVFGIDFDTYPTMEIYTWGGAGRDVIFSSSFPQTGWSNLSIVYNGSTTISIYENSRNTQNATVTTLSTTNTSVWIGSINPSYQPWYYDGRISNIQIYNRALSASEVQQNYNATKTRFGLQ
jgi:hypothetical protein